MAYTLTVADGEAFDLDDVAKQLRRQIPGKRSGEPRLAKQKLAALESGAAEYLLVVRGHEEPHTHPQSDLIFSVLKGGGYVELSSGRMDAPAGTTVVIPKGVCHAYHNTSPSDSVLLAMFPAKPEPGEC
ncbi:MAG: cupin domain-containing protein, partial [Acidobacteriota bacterium]|nr:cupin domain-containing protein [Acidobacteriota bacterium]